MPDTPIKKKLVGVVSPPYHETVAKQYFQQYNVTLRPFLKKEMTQDIATYLKKRRIELKLPTKDIAKHFLSFSGGITGCVWNWENKKNVPTQKEYKKLKQILKLDNRFDKILLTETIEERTLTSTGHLNVIPYGNSKGQIGNIKENNIENKTNFDITQLHNPEVCSDSLYWHGCYGSDTAFRKYVTPESYAHPAKASFLLMDRIFKHLGKLGLLNKNDVICDFMAGSGRTNIIASLHGYDSVAVELEPHFIKMIHDNAALVKKHTNRQVNTQIIQGDSRKLSEILQEANVGIVSPPYQDTMNSEKHGIDEHKGTGHGGGIRGQLQIENRYSSNLSNIGNLPDKQLIGIISPPYSGVSETSQESSINEINKRIKKGIKGAVIREDGKAMTGSGKWLVKYSDSESNIGNLPDKQLIGIVSPPYQNAISSNTTKEKLLKKKQELMNKIPSIKKANPGGQFVYENRYSSNPSNIGNLKDKQLIGITSPPYEEVAGEKHHSPRADRLMQEKRAYGTYTERNQSPQNIGNLHDKNLVGITSPPYAHDSVMSPNQKNPLVKEKFHNISYSDETINFESRRNKKTGRFDAHTFQNIGRMKDSDRPEGQESYLSAMLQVYKEAAKVMPVLVTVTKNPTRKGQLRRLDIDTARLLMLAGYEIVDYHRAILFEERKQLTLTGNIKKELKGRLSFFKRLSIQKGNTAAQWEDILFCVRK